MPHVCQPGRAGNDAARGTFLLEDTCLCADSVDEHGNAEQLLAQQDRHRTAAARRAAPLTCQERDRRLRHRISYLANDLVIPTGMRRPLRTETALRPLELLEYANSQLLQFHAITTTARYRARADLRAAAGAWLVDGPGWDAATTVPPTTCLAVHRRQRADRQDRKALKFAATSTSRGVSRSRGAPRIGSLETTSARSCRRSTISYRFAVEQTRWRAGIPGSRIVLILVLELVLFFRRHHALATQDVYLLASSAASSGLKTIAERSRASAAVRRASSSSWCGTRNAAPTRPRVGVRSSVRSQPSRLDGVAKHHSQRAGPARGFRGLHGNISSIRRSRLRVHPVGAREIHLLIAAVQEIEDAECSRNRSTMDTTSMCSLSPDYARGQHADPRTFPADAHAGADAS